LMQGADAVGVTVENVVGCHEQCRSNGHDASATAAG
jgi:hypothetical protein